MKMSKHQVSLLIGLLAVSSSASAFPGEKVWNPIQKKINNIGEPKSPNPPAPPPVVAPEINVKDGALYRYGKPWTPRGFTFTGWVAPLGKTDGVWAKAQSIWGEEQLLKIRDVFDYDTVRIQMSQNYLDPQGALYDAAYAGQILDAVKTARDNGFAVILSMRQFSPKEARTNAPRTADAITVRAWQTLMPLVGSDTGIFYEIFNEPVIASTGTPHNWKRWRDSMQPVVDAIRNGGGQGTLAFPGMSGSKLLDGATPLNDPLGRYVWALHPYPDLEHPLQQTNAAQWSASWGNFCANGNVCMITEWSTTSKNSCFDSSNNGSTGLTSPALAANLIAYTKERNIPIAAAWPIDWNGYLVTNTVTNTPTEFNSDFKCDANPSQGPGILLQQLFAEQAGN